MSNSPHTIQIGSAWSAPLDGGREITGNKVQVSTPNSTWTDLVNNLRATHVRP